MCRRRRMLLAEGAEAAIGATTARFLAVETVECICGIVGGNNSCCGCSGSSSRHRRRRRIGEVRWETGIYAASSWIHGGCCARLGGGWGAGFLATFAILLTFVFAWRRCRGVVRGHSIFVLSVMAFFVHWVEFAGWSCRRRICSTTVVDSGIVVAVTVTFTWTIWGRWPWQCSDSVIVSSGVDIYRRWGWTGTVTFVASRQMGQGHTEFLPEFLVVPLDAGTRAEIVPHVHVDVTLREVTVEDENQTLPAFYHLMEGTFVLESWPFIVEEVLGEHKDDHFWTFGSFQDGIGDVGV